MSDNTPEQSFEVEYEMPFGLAPRRVRVVRNGDPGPSDLRAVRTKWAEEARADLARREARRVSS